MTPNEPLVRWDWVPGHLGDVAARLVEHLLLTGLAVGIGFAVALGLSLLIWRDRRLDAPISWIAGVLYTVPSLALFALLIPFTGLGFLTAEIGLVSYTLLILIRAITGGLAAVPADVREAAVGMGYTPRQLLWRVELPLAVPIIMAGLRAATVSTIGLVTVTALIGLGGFGYFILDGLDRFFTTPLIVGAVLSVALAVVADAALVAVTALLTPWARARLGQ
jgi:osmoprotectant transport system permease protein